MSPILFFAALSVCFLGVSSGMNTTSNRYKKLDVTCKCGTKLVRWKLLGHSNEDNSSMDNELSPNAREFCAKFKNCRTCYSNGGKMCRSCPSQKFGKFCDKNCNCRNGGSCTRSGKCLCPAGFEGPKCERIRCGRPYSGRTPLIKYGKVSKIGQWPWQVALFSYREKQKKWELRCSGSIINNLWVLTAAHCVTYKGTRDVVPKEGLKPFVGKYYREIAKDDKYVQAPKIEEIHIHPAYNYSTVDSDIALIKLKRPVEFNTRVQPVCLPTLETSARNIVEGRKAVVTGWGRNENDKLSAILEEAVLPVVTGNYCKKGFGKNGFAIHYVTKNMFCAGDTHPSAASSNKGDSGGPVVFRDPFSKMTRWVIEGIVSWRTTVIIDKETRAKLPVYVRVSKFLNWIRSYVETPNI